MIYFYLIGLLCSIIAEVISFFQIQESIGLQTFEEYAESRSTIFHHAYSLFIGWCLLITTNHWFTKMALFTLVVGIVSYGVSTHLNNTCKEITGEDDKDVWQIVMLIDTGICLLAFMVAFVLIYLKILVV